MTVIAVVNDDTVFLNLMAELIRERGCEALIYREGNKAYEQLKDLQPDLIILDVRMESQETGWTLLELLTLDPDTRDIPVIVCSAAILDLRSKEDWLASHGIAVLPKPFDIDDLYNCIDAALRQR